VTNEIKPVKKGVVVGCRICMQLKSGCYCLTLGQRKPYSEEVQAGVIATADIIGLAFFCCRPCLRQLGHDIEAIDDHVPY
jgi:hypothetical protein